MKKILLALIICFGFVTSGFGQTYTKPNNSYGERLNRLRPDSTLLLPTGNGTPSGISGSQSLRSTNQGMAGIYHDSTAGKTYVFNPKTLVWSELIGVSNHNYFTTRQNFTSIFANKDSIPITTSLRWSLFLDSTTGQFYRRNISTLGVRTVGAISGVTNTNGASISNDTIFLHPASSISGGVVTIGEQTFANNKTFALGVFGQRLFNVTNVTSAGLTYNFLSSGTHASVGGNIDHGTFLSTKTYSTSIQSPLNGTATLFTFLDQETRPDLTISGNPRINRHGSLGIKPTYTDPSTDTVWGILYKPTFTINALKEYAAIFATGQVGIGVEYPLASAKLDVTSTTQGFLPPRMTSTQRDAISSPATGLTLYCTDCTATDASTGVMQTWSGSAWKNYW